jgi:hypothetical protein
MPTTTLADECESDVVRPSDTPSTLERGDFTIGTWTRSCPRCNAVLCKSYPLLSVRCECGWEWKA